MHAKCTIPGQKFSGKGQGDKPFPDPNPFGASKLAPLALDLALQTKILDPPMVKNQPTI